jgi:hypothetical protein
MGSVLKKSSAPPPPAAPPPAPIAKTAEAYTASDAALSEIKKRSSSAKTFLVDQPLGVAKPAADSGFSSFLGSNS